MVVVRTSSGRRSASSGGTMTIAGAWTMPVVGRATTLAGSTAVPVTVPSTSWPDCW
jgi:hypothetical protein